MPTLIPTRFIPAMLRRLSIALLLASAASIGSAFAAPEPLDRIIVTVNDGLILQSDLDQALHEAQTQLRARGINPPPTDVLRPQVLERLILTRIQTQRAQQAGIRIDDRELNEVIANLARQNGMTQAEFAENVRRDGMDFLAVREQIREEVLMQRIRSREVDSRVTVTDQDIDTLLAAQGTAPDSEFHLQHILISVPEGASASARDQARARAEGLLQKLREGADFAQTAIANSDGQQALDGGDLGWRKGENLPSLFAQTVAKLAPGQISDVLEASGGFHILKLVEVRGGPERKTVEETHAQHILIKPSIVRSEDQARALIRDLYNRIVAGEDLEALAKEYSDDPGSKMSGGDLGFQPSGVFAPEFQVRIDALKPGELSTPFHSPFGWHIARVIERRTRDTTDEQRRNQARQAIGQRKSGEEFEIWLRRLRSEAYVEYTLPADAKAAADKSLMQ
ncbi:peptidylprolyl isomerase [Sinimarinibacterium sp. NLF-5-8]|uniref:peptidylprolyl isomerase n=1 Tax=Sinimarinibacterium sp. NLF-5-8 TaxID=2698684 RepID=UPI001EE3FCBA|nr:peptidylprolyl isomerase [Sinimarinibacterium sp. NLF-5-8]